MKKVFNFAPLKIGVTYSSVDVSLHIYTSKIWYVNCHATLIFLIYILCYR